MKDEMKSNESMALPQLAFKVQNQLPPIAGKQRATFNPVMIPPPEWWAEALIPIEWEV